VARTTPPPISGFLSSLGSALTMLGPALFLCKRDAPTRSGAQITFTGNRRFRSPDGGNGSMFALELRLNFANLGLDFRLFDLIAYKGHLESTCVFRKFSSCHCFTQEQYIIGIYRVYTKSTGD